MRANPGRTGPLSLAAIVSRFGGRVCGDTGTVVSQVGSLENAGDGQIAFFSNPRYKSKLEATRASAVVLAPSAEGFTELPRIVADNPYAYFARLSRLFNPEPLQSPGVHADALVDASASVASSAHIGPGAVIGPDAAIGDGASVGAGAHVGEGVKIGAGSKLYPRVVIYPGCTIGARVTLHSGVVIGADGFGLAQEEGRWLKIPQIGAVVLGDDVEVGANTTIDRGALHDTVIEDGVKMDNQIQIAHNVKIGANTAIAACVGIAGSAIIGRNCAIGGAAMLRGHIVIADNVSISAGTLVQKEILEPGEYTGVYPFTTFRRWVRNAAHLQELDELVKRVRRLERGLESKKGGTS